MTLALNNSFGFNLETHFDVNTFLSINCAINIQVLESDSDLTSSRIADNHFFLLLLFKTSSYDVGSIEQKPANNT